MDKWNWLKVFSLNILKSFSKSNCDKKSRSAKIRMEANFRYKTTNELYIKNIDHSLKITRYNKLMHLEMTKEYAMIQNKSSVHLSLS